MGAAPRCRAACLTPSQCQASALSAMRSMWPCTPQLLTWPHVAGRPPVAPGTQDAAGAGQAGTDFPGQPASSTRFRGRGANLSKTSVDLDAISNGLRRSQQLTAAQMPQSWPSVGKPKGQEASAGKPKGQEGPRGRAGHLTAWQLQWAQLCMAILGCMCLVLLVARVQDGTLRASQLRQFTHRWDDHIQVRVRGCGAC